MSPQPNVLRVQEPLSPVEFGDYTGVSGTTVADIGSKANDIAEMLTTVASIYEVGGAVGATATALFCFDIFMAAVALPACLATIGVPVAQNQQELAGRSIRRGFAVGSVIGIFGYGKSTLYDFKDRTVSPTFGPTYLNGISQRAYNTGLALGYSGAIRLCPADREKYMTAMTAVLVSDAEFNGVKLYMQSWSLQTWIHEYAAVFGRLPKPVRRTASGSNTHGRPAAWGGAG